MSQPAMTFHESYGDLPMFTLRLIRMTNVTVSDYEQILWNFGLDINDARAFLHEWWTEVNEHIVSHSKTGMYSTPLTW